MLKKTLKLLVCSLLISVISVCCVSAETPYKTYTYSYAGDMQISPSAFEADYEVSDFGEGGVLKKPQDIIYNESTDQIIIADTENNRVLILGSDFGYKAQISEFVHDGKPDMLNSPYGVFMTDDGYLYVADTKNSRILIFDQSLNFYKELPPLSADILPKNFVYNPKSIAVDEAKNVYVVSLNTNMGVIALDPDGNFQGFIGAQKVATNPLDMVWRSFMSEEQLDRLESYVPVEYSNLTIDEKGFVYVTCAEIDAYQLSSAVKSRSADSRYAPIKKLNPSGTDVLKRTGFFPPVGEIKFDAYGGSGGKPSDITEVALLENNMYALLDSNHNKLFVYDSAGDLLYAFGGTGESIGLYTTLAGVAFKGDTMFCLDSADSTVTVSQKTEYGKLLDKVIGLQEKRRYDEAKAMWNDIISKNNNFDIAYLGIGKVNLEKGNYKEAMDYFRLIGNKTYYAKAFELNREGFLSKYGIFIFIAAVVIVLLLVKLFTVISHFNKDRIEEPARGKFTDELLYGFYTIVHPFAGYYGLKHEKRGSVRAATVFWVLTGISSVVSTLGACYLQRGDNPTLIGALSNTVFPLILWCVSNMCFTSLMDGKGTFKDVYIAVGYSTVPYVMLMIPCTLISYVLITDELSILSLVTGLALYWSIALVFLGMMTVHDYSFGKNIVVTVLTIAGIAFILFILLIFFNLTGRVQSLIVSIINEISYRS